uniref:Uncharacterized protein n=1 Tax=Romanomermis culicivorax TaxID=13658 RepID=A0A915I548_ROMCU
MGHMGVRAAMSSRNNLHTLCVSLLNDKVFTYHLLAINCEDRENIQMETGKEVTLNIAPVLFSVFESTSMPLSVGY